MNELDAWSHTTAAGAFAALLGLLWGSFANVCIYRWPEEKSVVRPGSHCSACQTPIRWYDNVPILSYLWLRGRCRTCKAEFSPRYLFVEAATAMLFYAAWWFTLGFGGVASGQSFGMSALHFATDAAFLFVMVVITFIDIDHKLIFDFVTYPAMAVFYGLGVALGQTWWIGLVGAAIGYGVPWLIGELYYRLTDREGLGLGDSTLLAVVGALMGWRGVVFALFGGSVIGSVIGIAALLVARARRRRSQATVGETAGAEPAEPAEPSLMKSELPFGPFLAAAAVVYLFASPWITMHFRL